MRVLYYVLKRLYSYYLCFTMRNIVFNSRNDLFLHAFQRGGYSERSAAAVVARHEQLVRRYKIY